MIPVSHDPQAPWGSYLLADQVPPVGGRARWLLDYHDDGARDVEVEGTVLGRVRTLQLRGGPGWHPVRQQLVRVQLDGERRPRDLDVSRLRAVEAPALQPASPAARECPVCQRAFEPRRPDQECCSVRCRRERRSTVQHRCQECGTAFDHGGTTRRYCSSWCKRHHDAKVARARRRTRRQDPAFRAQEARHAREYRARQRATGQGGDAV